MRRYRRFSNESDFFSDQSAIFSSETPRTFCEVIGRRCRPEKSMHLPKPFLPKARSYRRISAYNEEPRFERLATGAKQECEWELRRLKRIFSEQSHCFQLSKLPMKPRFQPPIRQNWDTVGEVYFVSDEANKEFLNEMIGDYALLLGRHVYTCIPQVLRETYFYSSLTSIYYRQEFQYRISDDL